MIGNDTLSRTPAPARRPLGARGSSSAAAPRAPCASASAAPVSAHERAMRLRRASRPALAAARASCRCRRGSSRGRSSCASSPTLLAGWLDRYGSPLNVIDPAPLARNAAELQRAAAAGAGVDLGIFFARKANKALALVDEARRIGLGVDVASERELRQVLERGVPRADDLIVTAAVKPRALLELCVASGATVVIDNEDELRAAARGRRTRRGRVAGRAAARARPRGAAPRRASASRAGEIARAGRAALAGGHGGAARDRRRALPPRRLRRGRPRHRAGESTRAGRRAARARPPARLHRHRRRHPDELPRRRRALGALLERAPRRRCSASASR